MPRFIGVRAMRRFHYRAHATRRVPSLALWVFLAVGVPAANGQQAPELWSIQFDGGVFKPIASSGTNPMVRMRY
jgi:hypothetical protein